MSATNETETISKVVVIGVLLFLAAVVFAFLLSAMTVDVTQTIEEPEAGETYSIDNYEDFGDLQVLPSAEQGLHLESDAYLATPADEPGTTWSIAAVGALDEDAPEDGAYQLVGWDEGTAQLTYDDGRWVASHNDSTSVSIEAEEPTELSAVVATWDGTELTITDSESEATAIDGETTARQVSADWSGTVDETRLWTEPLSASETDVYLDDPIEPLTETDHSVRLSFNELVGDNTPAQYQDDDALVVGDGQLFDGVEAAEVTGDDVTISDGELVVTEGGYLDGQERMLIVDADPPIMAGAPVSIAGMISAGLTLAAVLAVVLVAHSLLGRDGSLSQLGGGRQR